MKKKFLLILSILMMLTFTSCGNKKFFDFTYTFKYAQIKLPDGRIIKGKIDNWKDYEGEQLQITIEGNTYLVNSFNAIMSTEPIE